MPLLTTDDASIHYEIYGDGFPLLLIAPGGMRSAISYWENMPQNPIVQLADAFQVIAMDQRNAGQSTGSVSAEDGWDTYARDQLALMDHLGLNRFHVAGMCIGGSYIMGLIAAAPQRVASAVLFQTIGLDNNRQAFYDMFESWANDLKPDFPGVDDAAWESFKHNMYDGDFLFAVDRDFVSSCVTPLLVLCGKDLYHPESSSRAIAELAPNAQFIEHWKEPECQQAASAAVRKFLLEHS
jgi:pimeloyl-ACP methyl ester carboxylesterase